MVNINLIIVLDVLIWSAVAAIVVVALVASAKDRRSASRGRG